MPGSSGPGIAISRVPKAAKPTHSTRGLSTVRSSALLGGAFLALALLLSPLGAEEGAPKKVKVSGAGEIQALPASTAAVYVSDPDAADLVHLERLKNLRVLEVDWVDDEGLAALGRLTWIEDLETDAAEASEAGARALGGLRQLKRLSIAFGDYESAALLAMLGALPALEELDVEFGIQPPAAYVPDTGAKDPHLAPLAKASGLRVLVLQGLTALEDADLALLSRLKKLETLHLGKNGYVPGAFGATRTGFSKLKGLPALHAVTLASGTTDAHLEGLSQGKRVRRLHLQASGVGDAGFRTISSMTALTRIDVLGTKISDEGLVALAKLRGLEELSFNRTDGVRGPGLRHLAGLPALRVLDLSSMPIDGAALSHIAKLATLEDLDLSYCEQLDDASLAALAPLTGLKELSLHASQGIGNAGVAHLAALTSLETLNLGDLPLLTNEGLEALEGLTNLRTLKFFKCSGLTQAGLRQLQAKLPGCVIEGNRVPE